MRWDPNPAIESSTAVRSRTPSPKSFGNLESV